MKFAVLGASGFAGKAVCAEIERAGYEVGKFSPTLNEFDLLNVNQVRRILRVYRPTHIINCAAEVGSIEYVGRRPLDVLDINTRMILNLYYVASHYLPGCVIVNPIANCAYPGDRPVLIESELTDGPVHPSVAGYGLSRRYLLSVAELAQRQYKVDSINLLTPNMYGPGDSTDPCKTHALNALIIKFIKAIKTGAASVEIWGTGAPIREWLYVKDFSYLVLKAIWAQVYNQPVNLAQNHGVTVRHLADTIKNLSGYQGKIVYNFDYPDGAACKVMDNALFKQRFPGFEFTPLHGGIDKTIEYYMGVIQ